MSNVNEQDDHIEIDGQIFQKPFVEKPISAENHDVYIYFPSSVGGGSQRLFRKVNSKEIPVPLHLHFHLLRSEIEVVCINPRITFARMVRIFTKNLCQLMEQM